MTNTNTLFYTYLKLYPGKADVILDAIARAEAEGSDPEAEILDVL